MKKLEKLCRDLEAFETDEWTIPAILDVELLTRDVIDPCCGRGIMGVHLRKSGYKVEENDIHDWSKNYSTAPKLKSPENFINRFIPIISQLRNSSFFMNPPFSSACEFVDKAKELQARKIVCFQRWAWRESGGRKEWWDANPPARIWLCGNRATCWRFDIKEKAIKSKRAGQPPLTPGLSGSAGIGVWKRFIHYGEIEK